METLLISLCLFVCFEFIVPLENFSLIWRRHHYWWRASNHDLCSALMAIEQWGFFNVQHLLWHGPTVYNVHLRGLMTLTPIAERFDSGGVTNCFYDLGLSRPRIEPWSLACEAKALPLRYAKVERLGHRIRSPPFIIFSFIPKIQKQFFL